MVRTDIATFWDRVVYGGGAAVNVGGGGADGNGNGGARSGGTPGAGRGSCAHQHDAVQGTVSPAGWPSPPTSTCGIRPEPCTSAAAPTRPAKPTSPRDRAKGRNNRSSAQPGLGSTHLGWRMRRAAFLWRMSLVDGAARVGQGWFFFDVQLQVGAGGVWALRHDRVLAVHICWCVVMLVGRWRCSLVLFGCGGEGGSIRLS